jgi:hypothetical protein
MDNAATVSETVNLPTLRAGDEIMFATATGRVHAVRLTADERLRNVSSAGNLYVTFAGYRIHTDSERSSFGNRRYFTVRAATVRKF